MNTTTKNSFFIRILFDFNRHKKNAMVKIPGTVFEKKQCDDKGRILSFDPIETYVTLITS